MVNICVAGACGKMGRRIASLALEDRGIKLLSLVENADCPAIGKTFSEFLGNGDCGVVISADLSKACAGADCVIDFTLPAPTLDHLAVCAERSVGMVIGTTGIDKDGEDKIREASRKIPIVYSPNMSVGVNLVFKAVSDISSALGKGFNVKIDETHHVHKKDSPSGTAKKIASCIKSSGGQEAVIEAFREGEVVGDHGVVFDGEYERIEIRHSAKSRDVFVVGALRAAKFLKGKPAGLYSMAEVLSVQ